MAVGNVARGRSPASIGSGCEILCKGFTWHAMHMSKQTPPSFDGRQVQGVGSTFSVEGVVRDSLRVSDANDLSQRWNALNLASSISVSSHVPMLYVSTGTTNTLYSRSQRSWDTVVSNPERPQLPKTHSRKLLYPCQVESIACVSCASLLQHGRQTGAIRCTSSRNWQALLMKSACAM